MLPGRVPGTELPSTKTSFLPVTLNVLFHMLSVKRQGRNQFITVSNTQCNVCVIGIQSRLPNTELESSSSRLSACSRSIFLYLGTSGGNDWSWCVGSGSRQDDPLYDFYFYDSLRINTLDALIDSCATSIIACATPVFLLFLSEASTNRNWRPRNKELSHQIVTWWHRQGE